MKKPKTFLTFAYKALQPPDYLYYYPFSVPFRTFETGQLKLSLRKEKEIIFGENHRVAIASEQGLFPVSPCLESKNQSTVLTVSHEFIDLGGTTFRLLHSIPFLQQIIYLREVNSRIGRHPIGGDLP